MNNFITQSGKLVPAVSREKMLEIDNLATEVIGLSLLQMMENAGRNLALTAMELLRENWQQARYLILAGSGGNGGGAICAARHLANRGVKVAVCLSNAGRLSSGAASQLQIFRSTPGKILSFEEIRHFNGDLIIDGLIGYSLKGSPRGSVLQLLDWANKQPGLKLSLDLPSGIDANSGQPTGHFFQADWTMTLALPKNGLQNPACGRLILADIGIPKKCYELADLQFEPDFWGKDYRIQLLRQS